MSKSEIKPGLYKHKKGTLYEVLSIGRDCTEPTRILVVYKSLEEGEFPKGTVWIRRIQEFRVRFTRQEIPNAF